MKCIGCLPWFGSSSKKNKHPKVQSGAPSPAEYALEGVKISLELLKKAADFVPFPYVRPAVDTAITLLTIGKEMETTLERVDDLNKRIWSLMLVMIESLKGKKPQDIPAQLKLDIEQLTLDLQGIETVLRRIAAQNRLLTLLFKRLNEEKVEDCLSQLDDSLSKFHVSREINNAIVVWEMATGIKAAYGLAEEGLKVTQKGLQVAQAGLDVVTGIANHQQEFNKKTMDIANQGLIVAHDGLGVAKEGLKVTTRVADQVDEIHSALKQRIHGASTLPSRKMPTKPRVFYGRDDVVSDIAQMLTVKGHPHIALLGPGGMGKTSIALAVMAHDSVVTKFGERRFWVPCVEGRSPTRFLDILVSCLRISQDTGDPLSDILFELNASPDPRVILLDNFETPWNLDNCRNEIESTLCALASVPHLVLLVTMRSNSPPSKDIEWHKQSVGALNTVDARRLYEKIHPAASSDPGLDELLTELGHMPLATTLMANLGNDSGDMPSTLLNTWRKENIGINMLDGGSDSTRSINVSIALSVYSNPMKANPGAFTLLATLSMFPAGAQRINLESWAPTIQDTSRALATLAQMSLIDQRASSIHVLPFIRAYMLHPSRLPDTVEHSVRQAMCLFMADHKCTPRDVKFIQYAQELANEETNIQAILLDAMKAKFDPSIVDALFIYCWYQYWTRPRSDVIETVLQYSRDAKHNAYIAESLYCLGHIYDKLDRYEEACTALIEARDLFKIGEDRLKVAQCLLKLSEVYRHLHNAKACRTILEDVQKDLEDIGDEEGIADGLRYLGEFYWYTRSDIRAREVLETAQQRYTKLGNPLGIAHCMSRISRSYHREQKYDEARTTMEGALAGYKQVGYRDGIATSLIILGRILKETERYDEAIRVILEGLEIGRAIGRPLGIAQCIQELGEIYAKTKQYDLACTTLTEAIAMHMHTGLSQRQSNVARCLECLGGIYVLQSRREEALGALKQAHDGFSATGVHTISARRCMQKIVELEDDNDIGGSEHTQPPSSTET